MLPDDATNVDREGLNYCQSTDLQVLIMRGIAWIVLGLVMVLSGCSVRVPGVSADVGDDVHIDVGHDHYDHYHDYGRGFCPPGQAKKGNC